jgi:serine/threonine-protein kinase
MMEDFREADPALAQARRVNRFCERFELAWRGEGRPAIEEFLEAADPADRSPLFRELLALEIELRRKAGESPRLSEYDTRFPPHRAEVNAVFRDLEHEAELAPTEAWPAPPAPPMTPTSAGDAPGAVVERPNGTPCEQLGDYELLEEIARGGMGVVFKARHLGLKRLVALKMILSGAMATPAERARFRREAELAANLDHPNIVPIYEVREQDGILFFAMKLVDGGSLARRVSLYRGDPRGAARMIVVLARAVHYAHGKGFIHCDLKPSNILIDRKGQPQITDFGLARRASENSTLTATGAILGTPSYMAPEQASGQRRAIVPATDVYGLGAILYELLAGRPPFRTATMMETVVQVLERDPVPPHELQPGVPRELETICLKCLEKLPEDRYPSAQALAEELERFLMGESVEATGTFQRLRRWTRREPEVVSRVGGLAVVSLLTEFNHLVLSPTPDDRLHYQIQGTLALWALSAVCFRFLWRWGWRSDNVRRLWASADLVCLTLALYLLRSAEGTLLIGYPLMIAASGLWFRMGLVWFTTALAVACYLLLYLATALDWTQPFPTWTRPDELTYPNIYIAGLMLTGFVVARQLKRMLALGQYYEHRQAP